MEIVHQGGKLKKYKHKVRCECGCIFAYEGSDIKLTKDYDKYVLCPKCGEVIFIDEW